MYNFSKQEKIILIIVIIILMITVIWKIIDSNHKDSLTIISSDSSEEKNITFEDSKIIDEKGIDEVICIIHITGAVKKPGVYKLAEGKRIIDAVKIAGGEEESANLDAVNLAAHLYDGQKIIIPSVNDDTKKTVLSSTENTPVFSNNQNITTSNKKIINLNAANSLQLENLPGIGPVLANRIIEYRKTNGTFRYIEEIMNVTGIGEKKFQSIKEHITVY